ncbi:hypothetical protein M9Y10_004140 [Tritrichomonas musculus]|uniref:Uncharacterized protein n=1 Tax=Tritrichomonas musculus TaxID=1915356 RepID=A0ABR2JR59_9EUKA
MKCIRCILVGDNDIGKTYFLHSLTTNLSPCDYTPTVFDSYSLNAMINGKEYYLYFELIAKVANSEKDRHYYFCNHDLFILCFSLVSPESLENVEMIYYPEIKEYCPESPYILIGLKSDLRDHFYENGNEFPTNNMEPIPTYKGEEMKTKINAIDYIECSSLTQTNFENFISLVIDTVSQQQNNYNIKKENNCCLII